MHSVSVIIPSHNRAHTLARALDSVLAQTHAPDEVIVVDDGSTDGTEQLVRQHYASVIYLKQDNRGVSAARNRGIRQARGDWIALLDSDDEWLPHKLATQLHMLAQQPGNTLIHSDEIWIRHGVRVNPMDKHAKAGGWIFHHCLPLCAISPSATMIQAELFHEIGLFDETLPACEDYDLWLRISARYPVLYCEQPLIIKHGGHADQLSRQHWGMDRFRIRALHKCLAQQALAEADRRAAEDMLQSKLRVLLKGAHKHNNLEIIREFAPLFNPA
ncbi:glycosyl transferase [Candidatus Tenderia electrophaga]|jgi:glycosyltransferase involved in cell wall biosynthesis|uniref:Glycosyl transferase n=1 Tax=Candidatus Tenderia electrophaga TaxID=1748243 RepID=A0A0S2TAP7_9GAMM|nr:glycosyl transferase [Candidatus Tenderia electrophaga]